MTIPPFGGTGTQITNTATLNTSIRSYCTTNSIPYVDLFADMDDPANPGHLKAIYDAGDGMHLSTAGQRRAAALTYATGHTAGYW